MEQTGKLPINLVLRELYKKLGAEEAAVEWAKDNLDNHTAQVARLNQAIKEVEKDVYS